MSDTTNPTNDGPLGSDVPWGGKATALVALRLHADSDQFNDWYLEMLETMEDPEVAANLLALLARALVELCATTHMRWTDALGIEPQEAIDEWMLLCRNEMTATAE